jgi:hypothetical protein
MARGTLIKLHGAARPPTLGSSPKPHSLEMQGDRDLFFIAIVLWIASVGRLVYGLWEREVFGAEATLALGCVLLLPWLFRESLPLPRSGTGTRSSGSEVRRGRAGSP